MRTEIEVDAFTAVVCHDELPAGTALPDDIVVGPGGASRTLLQLTPRRRVSSVWDLGCGSGVQSVIAAQHAERVVATDIDARCLDFTQLSAAESGVQVETRLGSLTEPVSGERFDLIVSNPPFVIGQATSLVHRESPLPADGLTEQLLKLLPNHLNPDGLAVLLTSWLETSSQSWEERIEAWLPAGVDVWIGLRDSLTPAAYIDVWLRDAGLAEDEITRALWTQQLASWDAQALCFGWVVLAPVQSEPVIRIEDLRNAAAVPTGDELLPTSWAPSNCLRPASSRAQPRVGAETSEWIRC